MNRKWLLAAVAALLLALTVSCQAEDAPTRVYALSGPTGIGMVGLMRDNAGEYDFTLTTAPDEIVGSQSAASRIEAHIPVVVLLPCIPETPRRILSRLMSQPRKSAPGPEPFSSIVMASTALSLLASYCFSAK